MRTVIRGAVAALSLGLVAASAAGQASNNTVDRPLAGPTTLPAGPQLTNVGGYRALEFDGHQLSLTVGTGGILYAPSQEDDPTLRADISAAAGGVTVDYFDARVDTPTLATLQQYDCVFTWADFAYADNVAFGDVLADYVDAGGTVILGAFTTYTVGNFLDGRIMDVGYAPVVSPSGSNFFQLSTYAGDGITCIYDGVASLECEFRDDVVLQGDGILDGTWADGAICHAYRPDGRVVYSSGAGGGLVRCTGDTAVAIANACACLQGTGSAIDCACDGQFDIGDRVTLVVDNPDGNADLLAGATGTVICAGDGTPPLLVLWDEFDGGHDGNGNCACPSNGGGFDGGPIVMPGSSSWFVGCADVIPACTGDIDGDGEVGFGDLLEVLTQWGPCS